MKQRTKRIRHLCQRSRERFGERFTHKDHSILVRQIRGKLLGGFKYRDSSRLNREYWCVKWQGKFIIALYDPYQSAIISIMPVSFKIGQNRNSA